MLLAEIGIAVLLFLVGLKLDLHIVRSLGAVALATGLGQVAFTSIVEFFICLALGLSPVTSTYVAVALTFSSTIIIVKLLSDKREVDSLHGRIAIGFLIVQDHRSRRRTVGCWRAIGSLRERARDWLDPGRRDTACDCNRAFRPLRRGAAASAHRPHAGAARHVCHCVGSLVRGDMRLDWTWQGTRRAARQHVARLDILPRRDCIAIDEPA